VETLVYTGGVVELAEIAAEIEELRDQLDDAYARRADLIIEALNYGNSLRDIAEVMGVSHTAVRKAMRGR